MITFKITKTIRKFSINYSILALEESIKAFYDVGNDHIIASID